jgi:hypothetical protein
MAIEFRSAYVIISQQTKDTGGYIAYAAAAFDFQLQITLAFFH